MNRQWWFALVVGMVTVLAAAAQDSGRGEPREIPRLASPPVIDGNLGEWEKLAWTRLALPANKLNPADLSGIVWLAWDAGHLYLAARISDDVLLNANVPEALTNADCLMLYLGAQPAKQGAERGADDYILAIAPVTADGKPACKWIRSGKQAVSAYPAPQGDASGLSWAVKAVDKGWQVEAAIPMAAIGRGELKTGDELSHVVVIYDRDEKDRDEWKQWHTRVQSSSVKHKPSQWPLLKLAETVAPPAPVPPMGKPPKRPKLGFERHQPGNLFEAGTPVVLTASIKSPATGSGEAAINVRDYFGKSVAANQYPVELKAGDTLQLPVELGPLPNGYYELTLDLNAAGGAVMGSAKATFGVAPFFHRTAAEVRERPYRFGLKLFTLPGWDSREAVDACCKLGLQWTRALMQQTSYLDTHELVTAFPMNSIIKVERFPKELFDTEKYGPLDAWEKANGRGAWTLKTLPQQEPYKAWLREELKRIPPEQNVFEVWNEAWDKMSAEDLATVSQWIADVILAERPDAIIGPNLMGRTSKYEYDAAFIRAGGMERMKMVALHPYGGSENRAWLREYRAWLKQETGRDIAIYITEYGSHSTPSGPARRSEHVQAQRVVRQSLSLYAEGVEAMTPHWMGQREENATYIEHWFGFFRRNLEAKPVLLAHSTSARMVDGSRYVGDLWYGPGIGAMLFDRDGVFTLALWTREGQQAITVEPGVAELTQVDMVGREAKVAVTGGKLPLTVSEDLTYLVGVSPSLAKQASTELRADRWPEPEVLPRNARIAHRFTTPPTLDGKFGEWARMTQLSMHNEKVNGDDASGIGYVAWDAQYLYIGLDMRDNQVMNGQPRPKLYREDSMELFVSTEPRDKNSGFGPNDHQFFLTPTSAEGVPVVGEVIDPAAGKVVDVAGAKFHIAAAGKGWVLEVGLPWSAFPGFTPQAGARMALEMRVNDADKSHARWKIDPEDGNVAFNNPTVWSLLNLED